MNFFKPRRFNFYRYWSSREDFSTILLTARRRNTVLLLAEFDDTAEGGHHFYEYATPSGIVVSQFYHVNDAWCEPVARHIGAEYTVNA